MKKEEVKRLMEDILDAKSIEVRSEKEGYFTVMARGVEWFYSEMLEGIENEGFFIEAFLITVNECSGTLVIHLVEMDDYGEEGEIEEE